MSSNYTFEVIEDILYEMTGTQHDGGFIFLKTFFMIGGQLHAGLFPETLLHLGGDEVKLGCWNKVERIHNWLIGKNMTADDGYKYFVDRVHFSFASFQVLLITPVSRSPKLHSPCSADRFNGSTSLNIFAAN